MRKLSHLLNRMLFNSSPSAQLWYRLVLDVVYIMASTYFNSDYAILVSVQRYLVQPNFVITYI